MKIFKENQTSIYLMLIICTSVITLYINNTHQPYKLNTIDDIPHSINSAYTNPLSATTSQPPINTKNKILQTPFAPSELPQTWSNVDMAFVQGQLPTNRYWELGAPTDDLVLLEQREQLTTYWNKELGKVLSGTATNEEIHAYYNYQQKICEDYIQLSNYILGHYTNVLPERDSQLLIIVRSLHFSRLKELQQQRIDAIERSKTHRAKQEIWLKNKASFEAKLQTQATHNPS